jgi:hypothetical protein
MKLALSKSASGIDQRIFSYWSDVLGVAVIDAERNFDGWSSDLISDD